MQASPLSGNKFMPNQAYIVKDCRTLNISFGVDLWEYHRDNGNFEVTANVYSSTLSTIGSAHSLCSIGINST